MTALTETATLPPVPGIRFLPVLTAHLRKEVGDHRAGLVGMLGMVVAFALVLCLAVDPQWVDENLANSLTLGTLFCAVALFAPDLAEPRGRTQGFLGRLPAAPWTVFASKVLFLLASISALTLFAYGIASLLRAVFTDAPFDLVLVQADLVLGIVASTTLAAAFWMLAASWWLPRNLLAVPVAALLLALVVLPTWLILPAWVFQGGLARFGDVLPLATLLWLHPILALVAAGWSYTGGRRHGRGPRSSLVRGLAVAGVACGGLTGLSLEFVQRWQDLSLDRLTFTHPVVGSSGRWAIGGASHRGHDWPPIAVAVDLGSGEIHRLGTGIHPLSLSHVDAISWHRSTNPELVGSVTARDRLEIFDTTTLEQVAGNEYRHRYRGVEDRCDAALRRDSTLVLPDGRKVWCFDRTVRTDAADGPRVLLDRRQVRRLGAFSVQGFGLLGTGRDRSRQGWAIGYDLLRERWFEIPQEWQAFACLKEGWLVGTVRKRVVVGKDRVRRVLDPGWQLYDQGSDTLRFPPGMRADDKLVHVTSRGELLVAGRGAEVKAAGLFRVDVGRGSRTPLDLPGVKLSDPSTNLPRHVGTTTTGREVFTMIRKGQHSLTTLAAEADRFSPPVPAARYVGSVSDTLLITLSEEGALHRVDLLAGTSERFGAGTGQ